MPSVTDSKAFKASFEENVKEIKNDTAKSGLVGNDKKLTKLAWDSLELIRTEVEGVDTFFAQLKADAKYTIGGGGAATFQRLKDQGKANGYCVIKDWLTDENRQKLVGFFASTILPFASMYVYAAQKEENAPDQKAWEDKYEERKLVRDELRAIDEKKGRREAVDAGREAELKRQDTKLTEEIVQHKAKIDAPLTVTDKMKNDFQGLAGDTIVKTAVARRTQFFKDNMKALCDRLVDDWDDINAMFFPTLVLKKLIKVSTTGADYHKKGKQVLILTFKAQPPRTKTRIGAKAFGVNVYNRPTSRLVRLIYKPSDVELDWRVVGDTGRLTGPTLKHLLKANGGKLSDEPSLFAAINAKDPKFQATTTPFRLPVYSILPRNPGSELALAGQALPIDTSYGYIEFLTHEPAAELDGNLPTNLKLNAKRPGDWDWIAQDPSKPEGKFDLQNFYYTHGWYLLLGLIMNFGDQHSENIIVHERRPCLIDLEIIFKHRAQEIEATMLEYHYAKNLKDKNFLLCRKSNGTLVTTIGKKAAAQVKRGFADALAFFKANQAVFTDWLDTDEMKKVVCRYTPRATQMFTNRMWEAHSPVLLTKKLPDPNTPDDWKRGPYTSWQNDDLLNWYSNGGKGYGGRPVFAICTPKHDFTCYHNCDAPAYYRRLGELDLRDARGEPVTVNDPGGRDNVKIRMKLLSTGEGKTAVAILAGSDPKEGIEVTARDTGDAGMRLSITLEVNPGGDGDQPMTAAVASEDKDEDGVQQTYRTLTVTFPREGGAPKTPTVKAVVDFINGLKNDLALVRAAIHSDTEDAPTGATNAQAVAKTPLWARYPALAPGGTKFFETDIDGITPAQSPIDVALERYNALVTDDLTKVQSKVEGPKRNKELTLQAVYDKFANLRTNSPKAINEEDGDVDF